MVKADKNTGTAPPASDALTFEAALQKLETIVQSMEADDLPLETLLARFEEGTRLTQICQSKLAEAELKIQKLEKNATGEWGLKPVKITDETSND